MYQKALHIFRRDLRLDDNTALLHALEQAKTVIPCFILNPEQLKNNSYASKNAIQFMIASLLDLHKQLQKKKGKLYVFYGKPEEVVKQLITKEHVDAVFINRDYTPFSQKRDEQIHAVCKKNNAPLHVFADALLHEPEAISNQSGQPFKVFTPFYKYASTIAVAQQRSCTKQNWYTKNIDNEHEKELTTLTPNNPNIFIPGGTTHAQHILQQAHSYKQYKKERDIPAIQATTGLSAHNKFGTVSIRTVYHTFVKTLGKDHELVRQLYWRDFFTHIAYHYPHVFGRAFQKKYNNISWENNKQWFTTWCEGKTGFPIVDAGMRQLNKTGYMHNRVRMITASFLTKDLLIDWRWGEQYFAQRLIDYDPCVNNGSWQWAASTGCDAQPYFRIFNPWLQQKKFDPDCVYIKQWVDELQNIPTKIIHNAEKQQIGDYPRPIVDHKEQSTKAKALFKNI